MGYGVSTGAAGALSIRGIGGAPTTQLLVIIDGVPQYSGLMGHPIADNYQTHRIESVEVVRGPASVRYGSQAMGGVIRITTRKTSQEGFQGNLRVGGGSYGSLESNLHLSGRKGDFSITAGGYGNRSDGHRANMDFAQSGGSLGLGWKLSKRWRLGAECALDYLKSSNPGPQSAPLNDNDAQILRGSATLTLRHQYPRAEGLLTLLYNAGRHRINDGYGIGESPLEYRFHSRDHTLGITWQEQYHPFAGNTLTFGADLFDYGGVTWDRFVESGKELITSDQTVQEAALYVDVFQQLGRLFLEAGIRYDHHFHSGSAWVPQGSCRLELPAHLTLRASISKGFRFPTIREMFLFPPQNPDLKPESLVNYEIALTQTCFQGVLRYGIHLFYLHGDNRIQTVIVEGRPRNENTGEIENKGLEAEFSLRICRNLQGEANYSLLRMRYPVLGAPEHKLYGALHYTANRWKISSGIQYIKGLFTLLEKENQPAQKEEFLCWDLRLSCQLTKWISLWARGENLLGQTYEINAGYPMPRATFLAGVDFSF